MVPVAWVKVLGLRLVVEHRRIVGRRGYNMQRGAGTTRVRMLGHPGDRGILYKNKRDE